MSPSVLVILSFFIFTGYSAYDESKATKALYYAYGAYCNSNALATWTCKWCADITGFSEVSVVLSDPLLGFVGYNTDDNEVVISFRGTTDIEAWMKDFEFTQELYQGLDSTKVTDPYVHSGFYNSWNELANDGLSTDIINIFTKHPGANVLVTGHSLGASLAQIAGLQLKTGSTFSSLSIGIVTVITFGCPRTFDQSLAEYYDSVVDVNWRIVNYKDPVPTVPYTYLGSHDYYHTATEIYYSDYSTLSYQECDGSGEDSDCSYFLIDADNHLEYMNIYESCESVDGGVFEIPVPTSDNDTDIDCMCNDTDDNEWWLFTTTLTSDIIDIVSTDNNIMPFTTNNNDDDNIITKIKKELDTVSRDILISVLCVGWLLAFLCCCLCLRERYQKNALKNGSSTYQALYEV